MPLSLKNDTTMSDDIPLSLKNDRPMSDDIPLSLKTTDVCRPTYHRFYGYFWTLLKHRWWSTRSSRWRRCRTTTTRSSARSTTASSTPRCTTAPFSGRDRLERAPTRLPTGARLFYFLDEYFLRFFSFVVFFIWKGDWCVQWRFVFCLRNALLNLAFFLVNTLLPHLRALDQVYD